MEGSGQRLLEPFDGGVQDGLIAGVGKTHEPGYTERCTRHRSQTGAVQQPFGKGYIIIKPLGENRLTAIYKGVERAVRGGAIQSRYLIQASHKAIPAGEKRRVHFPYACLIAVEGRYGRSL